MEKEYINSEYAIIFYGGKPTFVLSSQGAGSLRFHWLALTNNIRNAWINAPQVISIVAPNVNGIFTTVLPVTLQHVRIQQSMYITHGINFSLISPSLPDV